MAVNSFFHTSNIAAIATEQSLYSNLIKEAIQIYGHDVYYLDRTSVAEDTVFGEDSLTKFTQQHPIGYSAVFYRCIVYRYYHIHRGKHRWYICSPPRLDWNHCHYQEQL